jgi:hypothetical protein
MKVMVLLLIATIAGLFALFAGTGIIVCRGGPGASGIVIQRGGGQWAGSGIVINRGGPETTGIIVNSPGPRG